MRKIKNAIHGYEAILANLIYRMPAKRISTIGVTGTDGKTTTTSLIYHILLTSGFNPAMVTTVGAQIGGQEFETGLHTTTPSSFALQKYIKKAVDAKCDYLILEVTSHALDQNRVKGVDFKIGVLTNITHDHLDYHKDYESYVKAKSRLFKMSDISILNKSDKSFPLIKKICQDKKIMTYSISENADFTLKSIGIKFPDQFDFNNENFLAAVSVARILNIPDEKISLALSTFKFPKGRQEILYDEKFRVVIDFAHTPNSFEKILPALKKATSGRLIHVFGSAGDRDKSKRPLMGEISARNSDLIVLTAEDPRRETISEINDQIKMGFQNEVEVYEENDRLTAIQYAISHAKPGDTVVITGKGHEQSINLGNGEKPWSDHAAVESVIASLK